MTRLRKNIAARSLVKFSLACLLLLGGIGLYCYSLTRPVSSSTISQEFSIDKGESVHTIATRLESAGLVRSALVFRLIVRQEHLALQAGVFQLSPALTPSELAHTLTKGLTKDQKITIPEGYRLEQIAETAHIPTQELRVAGKGLEGQLFPDTYFVKKDITAAELVTLMHTNFLKKVGEIDQQTLILASLVERETRGIAEKPIVAGILAKRLAAGWPLELDATIQYALGTSKNWWPDTTLADRKTPSRYNTYLNQGLPPTPICNPGLEAINAVKNAEASPYWFYLHDRSGEIHYAKTLEEQTANIATYLR